MTRAGATAGGEVVGGGLEIDDEALLSECVPGVAGGGVADEVVRLGTVLLTGAGDPAGGGVDALQPARANAAATTIGPDNARQGLIEAPHIQRCCRDNSVCGG